MRILLISHLFPKASDHRNGIFVLRQATHLRELGHEIEVVSPVPFIPQWLTYIPRWNRYRNQKKAINVDNFRIHHTAYIRPPGSWFSGYESLSMWLGMRKTIRRLSRQKQFDLIFAQDFCADVGAGIAAGKELEIPCVGMGIGADLNDNVYISSRTCKTIINALMMCQGIVCNSAALCKRVDDLTRGLRTSVCITRGTDIRRFSPVDEKQKRALRKSLGWPETSIIFFYAGYLQTDKGIFELVDAFDQVASQSQDAFLVMVGTGVDESKLKLKVSQGSFADRVLFYDYIEHRDIHHYVQASDVVSMPSYAEGMPNSIVEGIACGLPVLATRVGGIPEAAPEGSISLLVPPRDVDALAKAALRFCKSSVQRKNMGKAARIHAEKHFDAKINSRRLSEFLYSVYNQSHQTCPAGIQK